MFQDIGIKDSLLALVDFEYVPRKMPLYFQYNVIYHYSWTGTLSVRYMRHGLFVMS